MRSEEFLNLIGNVDSKFINEVMDDKVIPLHRRMTNRQWAFIAACFAVIVLCTAMLAGLGVHVDSGQLSLTGVNAGIPMAHNSILMIDVNPGIRLEVNDRGVVLSAEATNEDAAALMDELQLKNMNYTEAVKKTVYVMQKHEYLSDLKNSMLISVFNKDAECAEAVRSAVIETIQVLDANTDYDLSILSQILTDIAPYAEIAESHGMSVGRAALIEKTCKAHEQFTFDMLAGNNIQTINQLFEYISLPELVERIGMAAGAVPDNCKEKLGIDGLTGEELINFTCAISDFYDKLCQYFDIQDVAKRIGYEFDIACRQGEDGMKLWTVVAQSLSNEITSHCAVFGAGEKSVRDWYQTYNEIANFIDAIT